LRAQFFRSNFHYSAVAPDIDRQTLASVFHNHFLDSSLERHFDALFERQIKDISEAKTLAAF
jgi:hypothetical protein